MERKCLRCGEEMKLHREGNVYFRPGTFSPVDEWVYMELYFCPLCRHAEWVMPVTPIEQFEAEQKARENLTSVEKFEYTFRDYSDKQLQKVIDGRGYVDDAKQAAQNLLNKRKYRE
ncbi:MAG: hypothetical protein IKV99_08450 [Oscillospiraceae bacterium]|nr:hypothetical protein [Oscillospiraceae bacterium]